MTDEMKPCPFCRGSFPPVACQDQWGNHTVMCCGCSALGPSAGSGGGEAEAIAAWNHRPEAEHLPTPADALREALTATVRQGHGLHGSEVTDLVNDLMKTLAALASPTSDQERIKAPLPAGVEDTPEVRAKMQEFLSAVSDQERGLEEAAEQLAKDLSEAARRAVVGARLTVSGGWRVSFMTEQVVWKELWSRGLVKPDQSYLTPLGLAVVAALPKPTPPTVEHAAPQGEVFAPLAAAIEKLIADYGDDRPDGQYQPLMLPMLDVKRIRAAIVALSPGGRALSQTTLRQLECDRCRCIVVVDEAKHSPDVAHWGEVAAHQPRQVDQPFREQLLDLCGGCIADLVKFMSGAKLEKEPACASST